MGLLGDQDLGWPSSRRRVFATAIKKGTLLFTGAPQSHMVQERFLELFGCKVVANGSVFLGADSVAERLKYDRYLSAKRDVWPNPGQKLKLKDMLPPVQRKHLLAYEAICQHRLERGEFPFSMVCDLWQNPSTRARREVFDLVARRHEVEFLGSCAPWARAFGINTQRVGLLTGVADGAAPRECSSPGAHGVRPGIVVPGRPSIFGSQWHAPLCVCLVVEFHPHAHGASRRYGLHVGVLAGAR